MSAVSVRRGRLVLLLVALAYGVVPTDLVPDVVPLLGLADDLGVAGIALLLAVVWLRERRPVSGPAVETRPEVPGSGGANGPDPSGCNR